MFVKDTFASPFIVVCNSYEQAVKVIASVKFDVAFIDYRLHRPDRDGVDLAALLTGCQKIIVTGFDMKIEDYERCEEAGVTAYIQKPADRAKVRNSVKQDESAFSAWDTAASAVVLVLLLVLAGFECLAGMVSSK
jgi:CheY-like chemotaxis protein